MFIRPLKWLIRSKPTLEGAGVHPLRAFGFGKTSGFGPFLLLDDFRNDVPQDYLAGFPRHPHRGIETITYLLAGTVEHGDSMCNHSAIGWVRRTLSALDSNGIYIDIAAILLKGRTLQRCRVEPVHAMVPSTPVRARWAIYTDS
jgi:hypothetical protein